MRTEGFRCSLIYISLILALVLSTSFIRTPVRATAVISHPGGTTRWDALITATFSDGSDDAIFGVRPDATAGFDNVYDLPEPPPPVDLPYVQTFFHYPGNAPPFRRLHRSCIPPGDIMEWPLRVSHRSGTDNITLSWSLENVPADYAVLLYKGEDMVADMRAVNNYTFQAASGDFDFTIRVAVTVAWQLIETWTGTVSTPAEWQIIKIWAGAIKAPVVWQLIEKWTGSVQVLPAWQLIETWIGTVQTPVLLAAPSLISPANGTITSDNTPTFDWSDVTGAENYDLLVDNDPDFSSPEIQMTVPVSTYTPTAELPEDNYSWKVRARDAANNVGDWSSIWTLLISVARGVDVYISPSYQSGPPGTTLSYIVTVTNTGKVEDNYLLSVVDNATWNPNIFPTPLTVPAGENRAAKLTVTIPENAAICTEDNITVIATSEVDNTVSAEDSCIAHAVEPREEIRTMVYPAADVYAFSGNGMRYSRSQLKFDIRGIPSRANILSAKLWLYRFAADNWDGEILLNRVDDQLWDENITASEFDAQILTDGENHAGKFISPGWDYLDVENQLSVDYKAGHAYSSYRLRWANDNGGEPSVGIDDGRFLAIESELDELCIIFSSSEYNGSDPYLEVVYFIIPHRWNLIETLTNTIEAFAEWRIMEPWKGTISAPVEWNLIVTWTGTVSAPAEWQLIEMWTGTVKVSPAWNFIETWAGTVPAPAEWQLIAIWAGTVSAPVAAPPSKPALISPVDGMITSDNTPTFDWSDVTGTENYDLIVDNDPDFSSPEIRVTVPVSTYTPTAELPVDNYSWKVRARDAANNVGDWSSVWTLLIKTIVRRVEASISPENKSGPPRETLTYTVTVVNWGDDEDTYDLTVTDALAWGATISPTSLTIAAGGSGTATVSATIPEGTASGTEDEITVTATSRTDLTVSDSATCIASAAAVRGVKVSISPENQSGAPEEMLTYEVTVKNEGNVGDTYILSVTEAPDWSPRIENTSLTLYAGRIGKTTLTVTIPPGASEGASKTITVTAISVGDPTVVGSDTCRTIVKGVPVMPEELIIPLAILAFLIGAAILTAAYLLYVRPKKAARQRVLRGPRRIMLRGPRRTR